VKAQDGCKTGCDDGFIVNNENAWRLTGYHIFPLSTVSFAESEKTLARGGWAGVPSIFSGPRNLGGSKASMRFARSEEWSIKLIRRHRTCQVRRSSTCVPISPARWAPKVSKIEQTGARTPGDTIGGTPVHARRSKPPRCDSHAGGCLFLYVRGRLVPAATRPQRWVMSLFEHRKAGGHSDGRVKERCV